MELYQDAYGYTVLRLYVEWFLYSVLFALAALIFVIFKNMEFKKLFHILLIIAIVSTMIVSSINVDFLIANKNIQKAIHGKTKREKVLDFAYLDKLSVDAVPAWTLNEIPQSFRPTFSIPRSKILDIPNKESIFEYNFNRRRALKLKDFVWENYYKK